MTRRAAMDLAVVIASAAFFFGVVFLSPHRARAESVTLDQAKEILRLQYTEICSTPLPRGEALPKALNEAVVADPATWGPWVTWWNDMVAKYKRAGCGNA